MASVIITQTRRILRDTAQKKQDGTWDFDAIFNREIYPAIKRLFGSIVLLDDAASFNVFDLVGPAHTLLEEHFRGYVRVSHSSACTLTIPPDADIKAEVGVWFRGIQSGAGALTILAGSGVTINFPETLVMYKQWGTFTLVNVAANTWDFDGDVELA